MDNRELALLCWTAVALVAIGVASAKHEDIRSSIAGVVRAFFQPAVSGIVLVLAAWTVGLAWLGKHVDLWQSQLTSETVLWFLTSAFVLLMNFERASEEPDFFIRTARRTLGLSLVVELVVNLFVFPLPVELLLLPFLTFVGLMLAVAEQKEEYAAVRTLMNGVLTVMGFALIIYGVIKLVGAVDDLDWTLVAQTFGLPIWMTLGVLPLIYAVGLFSAYQQLFVRLRFHSEDRRVRAFVRMAAWRRLGIRAHAVGAVRARWLMRLGEAETRSEADSILKELRTWHRVSTSALRLHDRYVRAHAEQVGTDQGGRQLDQREFEPTKKALRFIAEFQQGRQHEGYWEEPNLVLHSFAGLPKEQAIEHRISRNRRSWFSWRRTVGGWYFAVGQAEGDDETIWIYDGPSPPKGPPGKWNGWARGRFDPNARNW